MNQAYKAYTEKYPDMFAKITLSMGRPLTDDEIEVMMATHAEVIKITINDVIDRMSASNINAKMEELSR